MLVGLISSQTLRGSCRAVYPNVLQREVTLLAVVTDQVPEVEGAGRLRPAPAHDLMPPNDRRSHRVEPFSARLRGAGARDVEGVGQRGWSSSA